MLYFIIDYYENGELESECFEINGKKPSYSSVKGAIGNSMTVNVMYWIGQRINFIDNYIESKKILKSHKK